MNDLRQLGARAAEVQDEVLLAVRLDTRQRLFARAPARSRRAPLALAGGLALAAAIAALVLLLRPRDVSFELAGVGSGHLGEWIAAPVGSEAVVRFSEGTTIVLAPEARVRVVSTDARGASTLLERGRIDAAVVHRSDSRWHVAAGPFEVRVTGTRFAATWEPDSERLTVRLDEGGVVVTGPLLGFGQPVAAGETLEVSSREGRMQITSAARPPVPDVRGDNGAASPSSAIGALEPPGAPTAAASAAPQDQAAPHRTGWRELAERGKYREALTAAEGDGFDGLCESASAAELSALADAARFGGNPTRARQALTALRRRFPGSGGSAMAAFILGRIAFDQEGSYADAARWFTTYLGEQPGGTFAREAAGRLIEARERSGDLAGAREAARSYLAAYPSGPHADKAKSLLAD